MQITLSKRYPNHPHKNKFLGLSSPDANGDYQQSYACTITLEEGDNSVYVQLCNLSSGDSTCNDSATELNLTISTTAFPDNTLCNED